MPLPFRRGFLPLTHFARIRIDSLLRNADQRIEYRTFLNMAEKKKQLNIQTISGIPRVNILGVGVSAINMEQAITLTEEFVDTGRRGYVCVTGLHGIIEADHDEQFRRILNRSFLSTPDGMPTVWIGKTQGFEAMDRVYGPDYMVEVCRVSVERGFTHYLYGGKDGIAERLAETLQSRFPGLRVVGTYTPPFRPLNSEEEGKLREELSALQPDFLWVGLSTPKQERFMDAYCGKFDVKVMVGVGAAFDILIGDVMDAPRWVKRAGLQWLHRLIQEPRRLWQRYVSIFVLFSWNFSMQLLGVRKFQLDE
jgi:N-acetylglucosaminyldiphosphoundecaprenol N-acetyl-beta-D-mannosaminyltransferase